MKMLFSVAMLAAFAFGCSPKTLNSDTGEGSGTSLVEKVNATMYRSILEKEPRVVVVDFYADWCGPCKVIAPILAEIAGEEAAGVRVIKVNVDDNGELARKLKITGIPFVAFYKGGKLVDSFVGVVPKATIQEKLRAVIGG